MKYDLVDLKLLIAIAEAGNVTAGASACFLSPSSASLRLRNLEEVIGTLLFERHARGVTCTEAGEAMVAHARACFQVLQSMHADLSEYASGLRSQLRLFSNCTAAASALLDDLQPFLMQHPGLRVTVEEHASGDIAQAVVTQRADIGIVVTGEPHPQLEYRGYRAEELVLVSPCGLWSGTEPPTRFADAVRKPMVALAPTAPLQRFLDGVAQMNGLRMDIRVHVSSLASVLRLVQSGVGAAIVPKDMVAGLDASAVQVLPLEDSWARRQLMVCCARSTARQRRPVAALCEFLGTVHRDPLQDVASDSSGR